MLLGLWCVTICSVVDYDYVVTSKTRFKKFLVSGECDEEFMTYVFSNIIMLFF